MPNINWKQYFIDLEKDKKKLKDYQKKYYIINKEKIKNYSKNYYFKKKKIKNKYIELRNNSPNYKQPIKKKPIKKKPIKKILSSLIKNKTTISFD